MYETLKANFGIHLLALKIFINSLKIMHKNCLEYKKTFYLWS